MNPLSHEFVGNILELACEIQGIPAPTFNERPRAAYFQERFLALGLEEVQRDEAGNVLGRLAGGEARPLVVSAHMDTVHPLGTALGLRILPDRIIGPGIGDNALGLSSLLGLVQWLKDNQIQLPGSLWVVANVAEEGLGDLRGMRALVDRFQDQALAYLVVEGMGLGTILNRGLGVERYRISVETPGGHSWVNYGQPSAIHELCGLVTGLTTITLPQNPCTTMNVGVIQGGTSINTIAPHAWMELDLRSEGKDTLSFLVQEVQRRIRATERKDVQVRMERIGQRLAGELSEKHPLVILAKSTLAELGLEARLDIASTDANLPLNRGYPAICVGITNGSNAHAMDEYILTAPVANGIKQLVMIVTRAWDQLA
jgi:acetylornithine deacetylase/succinyl-diaminopimelate desuccinylase-like protein